ncbi:hypothetical protein [Nonomuraea basaltis]|uniref:hypothetical protein n=1 Tax=Nonomuraea basaltis TaxID=2495887 RepID=UPI00110C52A5|nr:hypothetical protein [Nonomuraea basaltis]TMR88318.1 hypothetical protein EJK15_66940 [Nonomuraea basaltis]
MWTFFQVEATAPPGTAEFYAQAGMEVAAGHAAGSVVYIDDVELRTTTGWMRVHAGSYLQITPM